MLQLFHRGHFLGVNQVLCVHHKILCLLLLLLLGNEYSQGQGLHHVTAWLIHGVYMNHQEI